MYAKISENLHGRGITSRVGFVTCLNVCLALSEFLFELDTLHKRQVAISLTFLVQPYDNTASSGFNDLLRRFHLFPAIAFDTTEDMSPDTMRMYSTQDILVTFYVAHHNCDRLFLAIVI